MRIHTMTTGIKKPKIMQFVLFKKMLLLFLSNFHKIQDGDLEKIFR